jgi:hypothetical protein
MENSDNLREQPEGRNEERVLAVYLLDGGHPRSHVQSSFNTLRVEN